MLEKIGIKWSPRKDIWDVRLEELKLFKFQHGHCNVPKRYEPNKNLRIWVRNQQIHYRQMLEGSKSGRMTKERVEKLENIGFEWTINKHV